MAILSKSSWFTPNTNCLDRNHLRSYVLNVLNPYNTYISLYVFAASMVTLRV